MKTIRVIDSRFPTSKSKSKRPYGLFLCDCGKEYESFFRGKKPSARSCGCERARKNIDYLYLTLNKVDTGVKVYGKKRVMGHFTCECGNKFKRVIGTVLRDSSCGCKTQWEAREKKREREDNHTKIRENKQAIQKNSIHIKDHLLFYVWENMKRRCYSPTHPKYYAYGAKGVTVCDEWRYSYPTFYDWAITRWSKGLQLDKDILSYKLDINPPIYSPSTCMFVTLRDNLRGAMLKA